MVYRNKVLLAYALSASIFVLPQSSQAQGVLEACDSPIEQYCSEVVPGDGRTISCLYAHENYLDETCANTISDVGDILDHLFATIRDAMAICSSDLEKQCPGTEFGGGRVMTCLNENYTIITPECQAEVDKFAEELAAQ